MLAYLGTLSADRRLTVLVDMLELLRRQGMDARLLMVGDADRVKDREALVAHAAARQLSAYLEITGALPQAQAWSRLLAADIGISPFYPTPVLLSASPTKLVEYMALSMPVIANDHPEQRLILSQSGAGVRVPWGARHFARAVTWLMRLRDEERATMGRKGRDWVEAHRTYAGIADEVERVCAALSAPRPKD